MSRRDEAFERLYDQHAAGLLGFLTYYTGDLVLAEAIVADTFERVLMTTSSWRGRSGEKTWLYSVGLSRIRDVARRRAAETRAPARVPATPGADGRGAAADGDLLHRAMRALADEERAVVALAFGGGLSLSEIAEVLEERQGAVDGRLYPGLRRLRDAAAAMTDRDEDHLPDDPRDIAQRIAAARATLTPLESEELHGRIRRRVRQGSHHGGVASRLRRSSIAGLAAAGLILASGAGAVIASTSLGGSRGAGDGLSNELNKTFSETGFHNSTAASDCAFTEPYSKTYVVNHGTMDITFVQGCEELNVDVESDGGFAWRFDNGPDHYAKRSWTGIVPAGTSGMTVSTHGSTYTLPLSS
jgi:RNA polymerase sigma factor (sigma-70 family)